MAIEIYLSLLVVLEEFVEYLPGLKCGAAYSLNSRIVPSSGDGGILRSLAVRTLACRVQQSGCSRL